MKISQGIGLALIGGVCVLLVIQFVSLFSQSRELSTSIRSLEEQYERIEEKNKEREDELEYRSHPHNIEKLLREQFNYRKVGEEMIIVIPGE